MHINKFNSSKSRSDAAFVVIDGCGIVIYRWTSTAGYRIRVTFPIEYFNRGEADSNSRRYRQILKHDYGAVDHEIVTPIFDSLESLFISVLECHEKKAFYFNEKGGLQFDSRLKIPIMKKNNPNSDYWEMEGWGK